MTPFVIMRDYNILPKQELQRSLQVETWVLGHLRQVKSQEFLFLDPPMCLY